MRLSICHTVRILVNSVLIVVLGILFCWGFSARLEAAEWYKGAIHQHSFWSDGNAFPEEVALQYKEIGFHFVATSDHNRVQKGERWVPVSKMKKRCRGHYEEMVAKLQKRFGPDWVRTKGSGDKQMVLLKTFEDIGDKLNEPGKFLYMTGDENSQWVGKKGIHINHINLEAHIDVPTFQTYAENGTFQVEAAKRQAKEIGRPILVQLNHPNYSDYHFSPKDIVEMHGMNFLEVWNMFGGAHVMGDGKRLSCERLWDVVNTIRIQAMKQHPFYATATDDCHNFIEKVAHRSQPGRGFIVVRSEKLDANSLIKAMRCGDFYASTGVMLKDVAFDPKTKTLRVEVDPKPDTKYTIEFIGTRRGVSIPKTDTINDIYSPKIGQIFKKVSGTVGEYHMIGDELYVRAAIRSDRKQPLACPKPDELQMEQAFTQPVGF
ncbi:MAG: hypothetical protein PVH19_15630 [Planctomycetia bacterium]|jgi:hypothetical protein